jgi:hypothetical protein
MIQQIPELINHPSRILGTKTLVNQVHQHCFIGRMIQQTLHHLLLRKLLFGTQLIGEILPNYGKVQCFA